MKEIDTNRGTHLNYNLHERKDGLSDYDFEIEQWNSLLKTSVGVKILTGW